MTPRRAGTLAVGSVVVLALLVVLLVAWAATIGPSGVLRGTGPDRVQAPTATESTSEAPREDPEVPTPPEEGTASTASWVKTLAFLVNLAAAIALVAFVLLAGRSGVRRWQLRRFNRRRVSETDSVDFGVIEPPVRVAREMLADAQEQRRTLLEGSPRNAVVACWHRFETQGGAAGVERRPWETSSEYTLRMLDLVDAYEPAVSRLGALYREARFSEHELTEADRQDAIEALDTIHRTIGVRG
ncbi:MULTISPECIES: DUF4129 domain-containing protein [unclassified Nocardioides]|uniref:DUF4129 domain-containing protein n=1 Tax=unclassified Nocardioides TaxID=2615069 RepID=UPI0009EFB4C3|nr:MULTISPECIES: DUF4129 domain-containing protein [unclassified Nocardioides]GAW52300.1 uncharacterized protein (Precursor) [Nocardioides sp. PD653-B2]GAW57032.1 uncharacterized protein (Precursor) [Nocardioides sp. PD653]